MQAKFCHVVENCSQVASDTCLVGQRDLSTAWVPGDDLDAWEATVAAGSRKACQSDVQIVEKGAGPMNINLAAGYGAGLSTEADQHVENRKLNFAAR